MKLGADSACLPHVYWPSSAVAALILRNPVTLVSGILPASQSQVVANSNYRSALKMASAQAPEHEQGRNGHSHRPLTDQLLGAD